MEQTRTVLLPLDLFPLAERRAVRAVLTDIDDTLTHDGYLPAKAYEAMEKLRAAGYLVIPVTGRPAGWCDLIARLWPVDGVVGENGAFYFRYLKEQRRMLRVYTRDEETRRADKHGLKRIEGRVLAEIPGCRISVDQPYREADLAVDFAEDVQPLPREDIERIVRIFEEEGAQAKVSSIHVNGWFGSYDKLSMARRIMAEQFGIDIDTPEGNRSVVFSGDSPNDEPMFAFFRHSVAVANFMAFADRVQHQPQWLTRSCGGEGFSELAACLIEAGGGQRGKDAAEAS
ncbi:HAD-IIB family hydrolase [Telmatospirillum sp. J64-1]|uniref:HAD-IIB family hydrolase n=1 Tax=Telmatospirillum sp. J64-1 TaxID=2502183 RepID=UPI00115F2AA8|nr:HAD-IIB family hydrolase [Telmatospirillum sp. J64-1]